MSSRTVAYRYERLDRYGNDLGPLDGVTGGSLSWSFASILRASGTLTIEDRGQDVDWLTERIKITTVVDGETWDVGVFIPTFDGQAWQQGNRAWSIDLHSLLLPIQQFEWTTSWSAQRDTFIATAAARLVQMAGVTPDIPDNAVQLWNPMTWPVGTDQLTIVNDLLSSIGYEALQIAPDGKASANPYIDPAQRVSEYTFSYGKDSLYLDDIDDQRDIFEVLNQVIAVAQGDGDDPGPIGVAQNTDPADPHSIPSIGVRSQTYTDVEAATQAAITTYAKARLAEHSKATRKFVIKHLPVRGSDGGLLRTSHAVTLQYPPADVDALCVVENIDLPLDPTGLQTTTLRVAS